MVTVKPLYLFILGASLILAASGPLQAQDSSGNQPQKIYTIIFRGETIQQALQQLVQKTGVDLVYDPAIMTKHTVFATAKNEPPKAILRMILKGSGLDFVQLSSGTYVLTPAPRVPVNYGSITGRVIDKRTGRALAGANVMLADASGGAATNKTGYFNIPKLKAGFHKITITYVGFKPVVKTVWVPVAASTSLNFSLAPRPVLVEPIYISGIQKRRPASKPISSVLYSPQLTNRLFLGTTDAVKSLDAVTGINFNIPLANFEIQGGARGSQQLRLDGVPIYNPVSMGDLLGAFSPWAIRKIVVYKAGFAAPVGSQLSGVIDMHQDVGDSTEAPFLIQANPLNLNARFTQQISGKHGPSVNLMLAARGNIWRWYQQPAMKQMLQNWDHLDPLLTLNLFRPDSSNTFFAARNHSYKINYYDLHAAADIKENKFQQTRISAYFGKNSLKTDLYSQSITIPATPNAAVPNLFYSFDNYKWTNYMAKAEQDWLINARLSATAGGYFTHHSFHHHYVLTNNRQAHVINGYSMAARVKLEKYASRKFQPTKTGDKNGISQASARFTLQYRATKNYTLSGGIRAARVNYRFDLSDLYYNTTRTNATRFLIEGYLQNDFLLSRKTSFSVGSRLTFIPSRDLVFAEPRLAFKVDEPHTPFGYFSAKLAGGIYRQYINQFDVSNVGPSALVPSIKFWAPVDYSTTVPKAYHIALQSLLEPSNGWKLRLGAYYKWIPARLALNHNRLSAFSFIHHAISNQATQHQFITTATGYAYGASLSVKKYIFPLNLALHGEYQYGISRQRIPSRFEGSYQPMPFSQPQKVNFSAHWNIIPKWTFLLQWKSIWGRSWGFRKAYYDYLSIRSNRTYGSYSFDDPGRDRLPRFSQLNVGLSYRLSIGASALQFRFDVFNLLNHKNVLNWWLTPYHNKNGSISYHRRARTMTGIRPSLSIKFSY